MSEEDLVLVCVEEDPSAAYYPRQILEFFLLINFGRFALFFNHPTHCLVLAVRGTGSFKDVVTDLMADEVKSSL